MSVNYDISSKSDMNRFSSDLKLKLIEHAKNQIATSHHKISCPSCKNLINVKVGRNICPFCKKTINLTTDF